MAITIGIRELRQHASRYLARVRGGEVVTISEHGTPVAEIRAINQQESTLERLEREGKISRPTKDFRDFLRDYPLPPDPGMPLPSEVLRQMREHER